VFKRLKLTLIFISLIVLITGCAKDGIKDTQPPKTEDEVQEEIPKEPSKGGEMVLAIRTPKTLNPLLNEEYTVDQALKLIFDSLIDFDDTQKPIPNLASNWKFSNDGVTVTIKLREDVKWHDGTRFTAEDVIFSLDTIKNSLDTSPYKRCMQNVISYKPIDEYSIKINYNQPFSGAIYALYFPIIPAHVYGEQNVDTMNQVNPVGTGAYQMDGYSLTKELNLRANSDWFKGEPYIEKIKVVVTPDEETDLYSFDQGQLDLIGTDIVDWEKYAQKDNTQIHEYTTSHYDFIGFNFNKPLFQDKKLRKAIAYAIDRKRLLENYYLNHGIITEVPINPKSWLYTEETERYDFNIEKSKGLLAESGWKDLDQDGILDKEVNGIKTSISFNLLVASENPERKEVAYEIQNMLEEVGIKIQVEEINQEELLNRLNSKNFDVFLGGWKLSPIPNYSFAFHSSEIENGTNYISYKSAVMDNLLAQTFNAIGEEKMKEEYDKLQKFIADELPYISLYFRNAALITNERIQGKINPQKEFYIGNIKDWFIYEAPNTNKEEVEDKELPINE